MSGGLRISQRRQNRSIRLSSTGKFLRMIGFSSFCCSVNRVILFFTSTELYFDLILVSGNLYPEPIILLNSCVRAKV